jgi:hypothetical protein
VNRIREEQKIDRFGLVRIDIEGGELDLLSKPDWLLNVDAITMELRPHMVGDLALIPRSLERYEFRYISTDYLGQECAFSHAAFLYAARADAALTVMSNDKGTGLQASAAAGRS